MSQIHNIEEIRKIDAISGADLIQYSLEGICQILLRGKGSTQSHKKRRLMEQSEHLMHLQDLQNGTFYSSRIDDSSKGGMLAWKIPLLMCVDSCPIILEGFEHEQSVHLIAVGSQGGDIVLVDNSGTSLHRYKIEGKIEGEMSALTIAQMSHDDCLEEKTILFVPTYKVGSVTKDKGKLEAFEIKWNEPGSQIFSHSWNYTSTGEIKNKPLAFRFKNTNAFRVIVCDYDGSVSYLNAADGALLECNTSIRGAIHADPTLVIGAEDNISIVVASSSWNGTVTMFSVGCDSLTIIWSMKTWVPIYSSPFLYRSDIILFSVEGAVTSLNIDDGSETWKVLTKEKQPIFCGCCSLTIERESYVVFGSHDGNIRCISSNEGRTKWTTNLGSPILSRPIFLLLL